MAKRTYETFYADALGSDIVFTKEGKSDLYADKKYYDKVNIKDNIFESVVMNTNGDLVYTFHNDSDENKKTTVTLKNYLNSKGTFTITQIAGKDAANTKNIADFQYINNGVKGKNGVTTFTNTFMKDNFTVDTSTGGDYVVKNYASGDTLLFSAEPDTKSYAKKGNDLIITAVKGSKTSNVTVKNYYKMTEEDAASLYSISDSDRVAAQVSGKKITGGFTNDNATSTKANETFTLGSGKNKITVDLTQQGGFGKDTINLTRGEDLTLEFSGDALADQIVSSVAKNGKDMEVTVYGTKENNTVVDKDTILGKFILKNAATKDLIGIHGNGASAHYVKIDREHTDIDNIFNVENNVTSKGNKFTGTTLKDSATSTGKNETFALGATAGDNNSRNYIYFNGEALTDGKFGNDTVITDVSGADYLKFADDTTFSYAKSKNGKNIIITAKNASGDELGTVTLTNYLKNAQSNVYLNNGMLKNLKTELQNSELGTITVDSAKIDKKNTLKGDFFNQTITGGNNADTIYANGGTNTITGGKGADKMYAGTGVDTFQIAVGDATGKGDIIYNTRNNDRVNFGTWSNDETPVFTKETNLDKVKFTKSGNDLIAEHTNGAAENPIIDKVTIANYFKDENHLMVINGTNIITKPVYVSGKGTIKGSQYNDYMTGSAKADKIYTGAGNDEITAGGGNDTIYVDGSGTKTLYIDRNSGKDTVIVTDAERGGADYLNVMFDGTKNTDYELSYEHSADGKDLIINAEYKKILTDAKSTASVVVKDYFMNGTVRNSLLVNNSSSYNPYTATLVNTDISGPQTRGDSMYNIAAFAQGTTVNIEDESGNDLYVVKPTSDKELNSTIVIDDKAGKDTLIISDNVGVNPLDVGIIFDVLKKGSTAPATSVDGSLKIFSYNRLDFRDDGINAYYYQKGNNIVSLDVYNTWSEGEKAGYTLITDPIYRAAGTNVTLNPNDPDAVLSGLEEFGGVVISDFINVSSKGKYSVGDGAIETIYVNDRDGYYETLANLSSKKLESIRAEVAGWLATNNYESTFDVLKTGSKDDIQTLIAIYNNNFIPDTTEA